MGSCVFESKVTSPADAGSPDYTNRLLFIAQEEGRIRALYGDTANPNTPTGFAYDYFIKDHLGNIRMVLTDENQPPDMYPPATMEDATIAAEERYYGNLSSTVQGKPGGFDSDTGNHKVAELNYSNAARRIGPNALLRVMSGDKVSISVDAFYSSSGQNNSNSSVVADVVASLVSAFGGGSSTAMDPTGHYTVGDRNITSFNTTSYPDINNALKSDDPNTDNGKPKAYVNWILFDEQFNMVRSSSATRQVDMAADTKQQMAYTDIAMHSNGYLYVYLSNESPMNVFFDNFQVTHRHGPILEETHYYPFGLTMAGISSKALNNAVENKYRFNYGSELQNKEFSDGSGLDWYDATFRGYDPQIGRFMQIDILAEATDNISPYVFGYNNPVIINDPLGLLGDTTVNGTHYDDAKTLEEVVIKGNQIPPKPTVQYSNSLTPQPTFISYSGLSSTKASNNTSSLIADLPMAAAVTTLNIDPRILVGGTILAGGLYLAYTTAVLHPAGTSLPPNLIGDNTYIPQGIVIIPPQTPPSPIVFSLDKDRTAQDIISKDRKGSINKEFPDQYRDKTLGEIEKAVRQGQEGAKKALKLLKDGRFKK